MMEQQRRHGRKSRTALIVPSSSFLVVLVGYLIGGTRAFGYDAAVTMHNFVRTDSLLDPFTKQVVSNNHPLFSFLDRLVLSATGSSDELLMRLLPCAFSASTVALVALWSQRRWGSLAGMCAGLVVAAHPLMVSTGREVRGYSLVVLATTLLGGIALRTERQERLELKLASVIAVGLATHLYMLFPIAIALVWVWTDRRLDRRWLRGALAGVTLGLVVYGMLESIGRSGRLFRPAFPLDLLGELAGGTPLTWALTSLLVVAAVRSRHRLRNPRGILLCGGLLALIALTLWVAAPVDLYPRFFVWLTPGLGAAAAWATRDSYRRAAVTVALAAAALVPQLPSWARDEMPNRSLAEAAAAIGGVHCGIDYRLEAYVFYDRSASLAAPDDVDRCDVVVLLEPTQQRMLRAEDRRMFAQCWIGRDSEAGLLLVRHRSSSCNP